MPQKLLIIIYKKSGNLKTVEIALSGMSLMSPIQAISQPSLYEEHISKINIYSHICKIQMCSWLFGVEMVLLEVCKTNDEDGPLIKMQLRNISLVFHRKSGSEQQTKMNNPRLINRCPDTIYIVSAQKSFQEYLVNFRVTTFFYLHKTYRK